MESKIIKENKNPFLDRTEIIIEMENKVTPTIDEVKTAIDKNVELTVVKRINTNFGRQTFSASVYVYDSLESKEKIETIPQKVRKKIAKEKADAESLRIKEEEAAKKVKEEAKAAEEEIKKEEIEESETKKTEKIE